ncbi:hypothetical protein AB833_28685 [Chromatiales bacterium (ex Bugula neritina AB1)]|nr:hypothetical protein AB833_28685 [Chromatiales bacterium (ex Bugula neritina AB1)]
MDSSLKQLLVQPRNWVPAIGLSILWLLNLLPYALKIRAGMLIGRLLYPLARRRRHIAAVNIRLCFPALNAAQQQQLLKATFRNFGAGLIETAMGWWSEKDSVYPMVEFHGREHLDAAIAKGKGVILVGAHFSSLDLAAKMMSRYFDVHAVYRRQKNPLMNYALRRGRMSALKSLIDNRDTRRIVRTIRAGNLLWFAPDHDMGEKMSVYAPFFEQQAATVTITAKYVRLTGAPVVFCATHRNEKNNGYVVRMSPIDADFASGDDVSLATIINRAITDHILIDPAQYYWFHRKFKTQPGKPKAALYEVQA